MKQQRESTYKPVIAVKSENEFVVKQDEKNPDFYLMGIDSNAVEVDINYMDLLSLIYTLQ